MERRPEETAPFCRRTGEWMSVAQTEMMNDLSNGLLPDRPDIHDEIQSQITTAEENLRRMEAGLDRLISDEQALNAFRLANRAIVISQDEAPLQSAGAPSSGDRSNWPSKCSTSTACLPWKRGMSAEMSVRRCSIMHGFQQAAGRRKPHRPDCSLRCTGEFDSPNKKQRDNPFIPSCGTRCGS